MAGSLTIVGLGPARPEHVTLEAFQCLSRAQEDGSPAYGLQHVRQLAAHLAPRLRVSPLEPFYESGGTRADVYRRIADMITFEAFEEGRNVLYLVAGSPLFVNDAVFLLRRQCDARGLPIRVIHGLSFLDLVLDRVYWTGHGGLQLYSAWNIARDAVRPATDAPVLIYQLGEFSAGVDALDAARSVQMLSEVRDALAAVYGVDHSTIVLYSSGAPHYHSLARTTPIKELAARPVPIYSNLWVPALAGPPAEAEVAAQRVST